MENTFPNLRAEQARMGLTNQEVAKKINLSRVSYEQKKKTGRFTVDEIKSLCEIFQCDFEYLFGTDKDI